MNLLSRNFPARRKRFAIFSKIKSFQKLESFRSTAIRAATSLRNKNMIPERILFEGVDNTNLVRLLPRFRAAYAEDGVAIFPGFFLNDPLFDALIRDLR